MPNPTDLRTVVSGFNTPSVFLFKLEKRVFGGFADQSWDQTGKFGGDRCFIFSIDKDVKFTPMNEKKGKLLYQWYLEDGMGWGSTDLILQQDVGSCYVGQVVQRVVLRLQREGCKQKR